MGNVVIFAAYFVFDFLDEQYRHGKTT